LGDDVLTLVVESNIDLSLVMGLVVVHGQCEAQKTRSLSEEFKY